MIQILELLDIYFKVILINIFNKLYKMELFIRQIESEKYNSWK